MGSILQKEGGIMSAMSFKKGDLVTVSLPKSAMPFIWAQEYVIVSVLPAMSVTTLGSYEAKAIGSDVSEYFSVWSGSAFGTATNELGDVVVIEDTDEYNFNNSSCNK